MSYVISRRGEKGPETLAGIDPSVPPTGRNRTTHRQKPYHPPAAGRAQFVQANAPTDSPVAASQTGAYHPLSLPNRDLYTMISASCSGGRIRLPTMRTSPAASSRRSTFQARETSIRRLV